MSIAGLKDQLGESVQRCLAFSPGVDRMSSSRTFTGLHTTAIDTVPG
jgi:hypothetical protein